MSAMPIVGHYLQAYFRNKIVVHRMHYYTGYLGNLIPFINSTAISTAAITVTTSM